MSAGANGRRPIGWGIVGFGWVAQDCMAPAIAAAGDRLVAIADPDPSARARAEAKGFRVYDDTAALAADPQVEAVYVATPNHLHPDAVELIAVAGKAVLCEKPMATSLAEAERMAVACRRAGILYGTAFDQRHHPAHRAIREAIGGGALGRVTAIRILYACWVGPDWSAEAGRENWRIDRDKAGGGALIDLAPHGLDLVEFLLGEPMIEIAALTQSRVQGYDVDDGAVLIGTSAAGILVTLHVAYNCPEALPRRRLEVVGSAAMLLAEDTMGQTPGGRVTLIDGRTGEGTALAVLDDSPFVAQVRAFGTALRGGNDGAFSIERDLGTMRLIERAYSGRGSPLPSGEGQGEGRALSAEVTPLTRSTPAGVARPLPLGEVCAVLP